MNVVKCKVVVFESGQDTDCRITLQDEELEVPGKCYRKGSRTV